MGNTFLDAGKRHTDRGFMNERKRNKKKKSRSGSYLTGEPRPVPAALVDRVDQEPVEYGQHQERHAYKRHYAKPVVRLFVDVVPAQIRAALLEFAGGRVDGNVPLVRCGRRARDTEQRHESDDALGPGLGAQDAAPERMAHGYVPLHGERHGQQYRSVTCGINYYTVNRLQSSGDRSAGVLGRGVQWGHTPTLPPRQTPLYTKYTFFKIFFFLYCFSRAIY